MKYIQVNNQLCIEKATALVLPIIKNSLPITKYTYLNADTWIRYIYLWLGTWDILSIYSLIEFVQYEVCK